MLVLKLAYSKELDFVRELQELRDILKKKDIAIGIVENMEGDTHILKIICDDKDYSEKLINRINIYVSNMLYRLVIDQYKVKEMLQFLTNTYFFLKQEEIISIEGSIMEVLNLEVKPDDDIFIYCYNKINNINDKIKNCIDENKEININGFFTFRMKELREDIEDIIDKLVERYIVEKEYEEFIRLLKYFVEIQDSKIGEVNLSINSNGMYLIKDEDDKDIFNLFLEELSLSNLSIMGANVEDIIISGLIMNVPKKINIYGKENCKNKEFIKTIEKVFGERVKIINVIKSSKI